jgi:hypothetical protein
MAEGWLLKRSGGRSDTPGQSQEEAPSRFSSVGEARRKWEHRYFVLLRGQLSYYQNPEQYQRGAPPQGQVQLRHASLWDYAREEPKLKGRVDKFIVVTPGRMFYLCAESPEDLDMWRTAIGLVIVKVPHPTPRRAAPRRDPTRPDPTRPDPTRTAHRAPRTAHRPDPTRPSSAFSPFGTAAEPRAGVQAMRTWSPTEVKTWVGINGMPRWAMAFYDQQVDGRRLRELQDPELLKSLVEDERDRATLVHPPAAKCGVPARAGATGVAAAGPPAAAADRYRRGDYEPTGGGCGPPWGVNARHS